MADLHAELLARLQAERDEALRRGRGGRPLWPAPSPADDAGVMFPWLCAVVEAQGQAIEELRAERDALAARVDALEKWTGSPGGPLPFYEGAVPRAVRFVRRILGRGEFCW